MRRDRTPMHIAPLALNRFSITKGREMLGKRLDRIERNRPALGASPPLDLTGLAPDVVARITAAMEGGTFPRGLRDADLQALVDLANEQGAA